jgi:hypothetical protein
MNPATAGSRKHQVLVGKRWVAGVVTRKRLQRPGGACRRQKRTTPSPRSRISPAARWIRDQASRIGVRPAVDWRTGDTRHMPTGRRRQRAAPDMLTMAARAGRRMHHTELARELLHAQIRRLWEVQSGAGMTSQQAASISEIEAVESTFTDAGIACGSSGRCYPCSEQGKVRPPRWHERQSAAKCA